VHLEINPRITIDGDRARCTNMYAAAFTQEDGLARVTLLGHHHSEMIRTAEGWKIKQRHNVVNLPETGHP
jgi:hypothetical protein